MNRFFARISTKQIQELQKFLALRLSSGRYQHSLRVARTARLFARRWRLNQSLAYLAGLSHDLAREMSDAELLSYAFDHGYAIQKDEHTIPMLLHGQVGASILALEWNIRHPAVLEAIRHHTLGFPGMGTLARLLFVVDYIEPGRRYLDRHFRRQIWSMNLDQAVRTCIEHNSKRGKKSHPLTYSLHKYLSKGQSPVIVDLVQKEGQE